MTDIHRTMIVPAALAPLARALAAGLSPGGVGMWVVGLSPTGAEPATHYVSSGLIAPQFGGVMQDAGALHAACVAAGASVTLAQCQALVSQSDVSGGDPFGAFERLGLKLVVGTL
jgi:hypothetical protein